MGRFPWIVLLAAIALLLPTGCGGTERDAAPSVGSPAEPTLLFLAGDGELTVVDVDAGRAELRPLPVLAPGGNDERHLVQYRLEDPSAVVAQVDGQANSAGWRRDESARARALRVPCLNGAHRC